MFDILISTITPEESLILKDYMKANKAPAGKIIMEMGEDKRDMYFIISGKYEVYSSLCIANHCLVLHLASLEGPELLGEANLFLNQERAASIIATSECKYFLLSYEKLEELKEKHPQIAIKVMEYAGNILSKRFLDMQNNIHNRLVGSAENIQTVLNKMNTYVGPTKKCSSELSQKLFAGNLAKTT